MILCEGGLITGEHLPITLAGAARAATAAPAASPAPAATQSASQVPAGSISAGPIPPEGLSLDAVERELIQKAMAQAHNNKSEAARLLGLARGQLYSRLKRHGLDSAGS
jgi:DNA-binding NtrC family response regulator